MTPGVKPLVAGNWKMNGTSADLDQLAAMIDCYTLELQNRLDMLVCVPATLLFRASETVKNGPIKTGGQDCHWEASGAHTGDISTAMISDAGGSAVIVGHSERRSDHGETDLIVNRKATAALASSLMTIVCIGETEEERKSGKTLDVLGSQLTGSIPENRGGGELVVAYEPVWAIGTGLTPTVEDVREAHSFVREKMVELIGIEGERTRLLYGGSVKPANAGSLLGIENVDGALVGGASLKAEDFLGIAVAYNALV
jgi:triosephosphate isomerase